MCYFFVFFLVGFALNLAPVFASPSLATPKIFYHDNNCNLLRSDLPIIPAAPSALLISSLPFSSSLKASRATLSRERLCIRRVSTSNLPRNASFACLPSPCRLSVPNGKLPIRKYVRRIRKNGPTFVPLSAAGDNHCTRQEEKSGPWLVFSSSKKSPPSDSLPSLN